MFGVQGCARKTDNIKVTPRHMTPYSTTNVIV